MRILDILVGVIYTSITRSMVSCEAYELLVFTNDDAASVMDL